MTPVKGPGFKSSSTQNVPSRPASSSAVRRRLIDCHTFETTHESSANANQHAREVLPEETPSSRALNGDRVLRNSLTRLLSRLDNHEDEMEAATEMITNLLPFFDDMDEEEAPNPAVPIAAGGAPGGAAGGAPAGGAPGGGPGDEDPDNDRRRYPRRPGRGPGGPGGGPPGRGPGRGPGGGPPGRDPGGGPPGRDPGGGSPGRDLLARSRDGRGPPGGDSDPGDDDPGDDDPGDNGPDGDQEDQNANQPARRRRRRQRPDFIYERERKKILRSLLILKAKHPGVSKNCMEDLFSILNEHLHGIANILFPGGFRLPKTYESVLTKSAVKVPRILTIVCVEEIATGILTFHPPREKTRNIRQGFERVFDFSFTTVLTMNIFTIEFRS